MNINVPTAPEVGLYLDECFFTSYNQKWKDTHEELSMKDYEEEAEDFKMKHIYSHIASTEHREGVVALWLHSLNHRNYPDLRYGSNPDSAAENPDSSTAKDMVLTDNKNTDLSTAKDADDLCAGTTNTSDLPPAKTAELSPANTAQLSADDSAVKNNKEMEE